MHQINARWLRNCIYNTSSSCWNSPPPVSLTQLPLCNNPTSSDLLLPVTFSSYFLFFLSLFYLLAHIVVGALCFTKILLVRQLVIVSISPFFCSPGFSWKSAGMYCWFRDPCCLWQHFPPLVISLLACTPPCHVQLPSYCLKKNVFKRCSGLF